MAVPTDLTAVSVTAASNSPSGSDSIGVSLDDFLRQIQAMLKEAGATLYTASGTADAITFSTTPAFSAYATGQRFWIKASGANTAAVTLNINGIGAKSLLKNGATALAAGDIPAANSVFCVTYDGTQFQAVNITDYAQLVTLTGSQTLTNKTLTSPAINGTVTTTGLTLPALTLGGNVSSSGNPSLNIGTGALTAGSGTFSGTLTAGTGAASYTFGGGSAAPSGVTDKDVTLQAWNVTAGTNEYAGDLILQSGKGIGGGSGKLGSVIVRTGISGGSSTTPMTLITIGTFSSTGLAVTGALSCTGVLSKGSGSFRIDHPLKPKTHQLVHSFIEGPQADLIYRGKVALINGSAQINIDTVADMTEGTFVALCRDVQVFTTNESGWNHVRGSVTGNTLTIECQDTASADLISWMVIGERKDPHMYETDWTDEDGKVIVEPLKPTPSLEAA